MATALRLSYRDMFRNIEERVGQSVYFQGQVVQVQESSGNSFGLRVNVTPTSYGWTDDVYLYYQGPRIIEGDIVEFVARVSGPLTYKTVQGAERTIPQLVVSRLRLRSSASTPTPTPTPTPTAAEVVYGTTAKAILTEFQKATGGLGVLHSNPQRDNAFWRELVDGHSNTIIHAQQDWVNLAAPPRYASAHDAISQGLFHYAVGAHHLLDSNRYIAHGQYAQALASLESAARSFALGEPQFALGLALMP